MKINIYKRGNKKQNKNYRASKNSPASMSTGKVPRILAALARWMAM